MVGGLSFRPRPTLQAARISGITSDGPDDGVAFASGKTTVATDETRVVPRLVIARVPLLGLVQIDRLIGCEGRIGIPLSGIPQFCADHFVDVAHLLAGLSDDQRPFLAFD